MTSFLARIAKFRLAIFAIVLTTIQMVILVPVMSRLKTDKPLGPVYARADTALGQSVYDQNCTACHGPDAAGNPELKASMPGVDIRAVVAGSPNVLRQVIRNGKGGMPPFPTLSDEQVTKLIAYLQSMETGK